jgi:L-asparaginase II
MSYRPVVEVVRGGTVESIHYGAIAVTDGEGNLLGSWGRPDDQIFLRSAAKPFQALPLLESGAAAAYRLNPEQIALVCASHGGTDKHVEVLHSLQKAAGVTENDLQCGVHPPLDNATAERLIREGVSPTPNRHNCSGKHTGMLTTSRYLDATIDDYLSPEHPVQRKILSGVSEMFDRQRDELVLGIDGCSAPTFAAPIQTISTAYARLADPTRFSDPRQQACRQIWKAMTEHPYLVAGEGRFDTILMEMGSGSILAKGGAEGVQAVAIAPNASGKTQPAIGIAIKIADGDRASRARPLVTLEVLRQLKLVPPSMIDALAEHIQFTVSNWRGIKVGSIRPCFTLK